MKPFLGIDVTSNKNNEELNGGEFLVQKTSAALARSLEQSMEQAEETFEEAKIPVFFRIAQYVCGLTGLLMLAGIAKADVSLSQAYQNAPWAFWIAGIGLPIWLILWLWSKKKSKTVLETDESVQTASHLEAISEAIYAELSVPADTTTVDVLSFFYKVKDGAIKVHEKPMQMAPYLNPEFKLYTDEENFYLANLEGKYAFPLSSIVALHTEDKRIRIAGWNKDVPFGKGNYAQYKLTTDNFGCIHCKGYHILEIRYEGESLGIYIPTYELPAFERFAK